GAGHAERVVVERPATGLVAVVEDFRRAVETGGGERYLAVVGLQDQVIEGHDPVAHAHMVVAEFDVFLGDLPVPGGELDEALPDDLGGVLRSLAVQVGAGGGGGGRGVGHLVGVGRGDLHAVDI